MIFPVKKTIVIYMVHVAIIPDGNRRWAKNRNLPFFMGHKEGADRVLPELVRAARDLGIEYFTFWTTSTENLTKRPKKEIEFLFLLMRQFLKSKVDLLHEEGARILAIGNIEALPGDIKEGIKSAVEKTKDNKKITTIFAINYGGREELVRAVKKIVRSGVEAGNVCAENISGSVDTAGIPDPDLIIRTGGEKRMSGFMLWQSEYAEMMFLDLLFPDFNRDLFQKCIDDYKTRQRRFGK